MRKYTITLILFLLLGEVNIVKGQSRRSIDSLNHLLLYAPLDTNRNKIYGNLAWIYAGTRDKLDTARMYADSIHALALKLKHKGGIIYSHFYYGIVDRHEGNLESSLSHFEKYVDYHQQKRNNHLVATGLFQIGVIYRSMGSYEKSLSTLYKVLKIHKQNEYLYGIGFTLNVIAGLQRTFENYEDALKSYHKAIEIHKSIDNEYDLSISLTNIGNAYGEQGQYDSALFYYNESLEINTKLDNKAGVGYVLENLGSLYLNMGDLPKALNYQLKSLAIREALPQKRELALSLHKVGKVYRELKDHEKSENYLLQSLEISKQLKAKPQILDNYEDLAILFELKGDFYKANEYQKQYRYLRDSLLNEEKINQIAVLETRYKTAEKDQQIILLSKENEIKEARAKQQFIFRNALMGIIFLILLLAGLIYYTLRQKLKNQRAISSKNEEIKTTNYQRKLTELEIKALRSQMNPHFIFNCMNSINTMILNGESEEASRYLNKFSRLIRLTLENSENTSISLEDELSMLETYIQLESVRFQGKINYEILVNPSIDQSEIHLPSMVLQPFIENAIWHGLMHKEEPGKVKIIFNEEGDELKCTIEDDGVGRKMALKLTEKLPEKNKSMGIKITEERLKLISKNKINNWIQIVDLKDQFNKAIGTRVNISIPIN